MPNIQIGHHLLHFQVEGAGPDVLMIHGMASSHRMWERPMQRLAAVGLRAWALDLPGCGESSQPSEGWYTIANLTAMVERFADRVGIRRAVMIGNSMGGAIALALADWRPQLTSALVLVAPVVSGRLGLELHLLFETPLGQQLLNVAQRHNVLGRIGELPTVSVPWLAQRMNPALRRDVQDLAHATPEAAIGALRAVMDFDFTDRLATIHAPALVVVGTRDVTVPPSEGALAAAGIPGARLVKLRGIGHQPVDECPEKFDRLLLQFLNESVR